MGASGSVAGNSVCEVRGCSVDADDPVIPADWLHVPVAPAEIKADCIAKAVMPAVQAPAYTVPCHPSNDPEHEMVMQLLVQELADTHE